MKTIAIFLLFQFMVLFGYCQTGSNEYTSATFNYSSSLYKYMKDKFKDTIELRRLETGVLYPIKGQLFATTYRKLFKGNHYTVFAYTDDRVKDFSLKCYKNNELVKEITSGEKEGSFEHIGKYELYSFNATEDAVYTFDIIAPQDKAGRYGLMIFSSKSADQSTDSGNDNTVSGGNNNNNNASAYATYNVDYYQISTFDKAKNAYGDWGEKKNYQCTFSLNYDQTQFKEVSAGKTYYYKVQSKTTSGNQKWFVFEVTNNSNQTLKFYMPTSINTDGVFRMARDMTNNGVTTNYLVDYHIVK